MGTQGFGLPDLPPEWGEVVIPDDPGELHEEAAFIRKELRRASRRARRAARARRIRRRLGLPDGIGDPEDPSLVLPLLILAVAVLVTLIGMIIATWPGLSGSPDPQPSGSGSHPNATSKPAVTGSAPLASQSTAAGT